MVERTERFCTSDSRVFGDILDNSSHFAQKYLVNLERTGKLFEIGITGCPDDVSNAYREMEKWRMYV